MVVLKLLQLLILCLFLLSGSLLQNAYSKELPALKEGSRVQITTSSISLQKPDKRALRRGIDPNKTKEHMDPGELVSITSDSVIIKNMIDNNLIFSSFSLSQIDKLETLNGRKGSSKRGAIIGGGIFFVSGVIIGVAYDGPQIFSRTKKSSSEKITSGITGGVFFGAIGALVGAGIGTMFRTDNWDEVPSSDWKISFVPINNQDIGLQLNLNL